MPKAAIELDAAVRILPLPRIGRAIVDFVQTMSQTRD
jgi:chemotaxis response regulator CheB